MLAKRDGSRVFPKTNERDFRQGQVSASFISYEGEKQKKNLKLGDDDCVHSGERCRAFIFHHDIVLRESVFLRSV